MKFVAISDVHIKKRDDISYKLMIEFLDREETKDSDYIFLLGDIFDLMSGNHQEYYERFATFFDKIHLLINSGKLIYYFEGNHDLHLEKLFRKILKINNSLNFKVLKEPLFKKIDSKNFYFSHGDELDILNTSYQKYKKIIQNKPMELFSNYLMPLSLLDYVGERASANSRKRGKKTFDENKERKKYRQYVEELDGQIDNIVCGHSHILEEYRFNSNGQPRTYINNGYLPKTKKFTVWDGQRLYLQELTSVKKLIS